MTRSSFEMLLLFSQELLRTFGIFTENPIVKEGAEYYKKVMGDQQKAVGKVLRYQLTAEISNRIKRRVPIDKPHSPPRKPIPFESNSPAFHPPRESNEFVRAQYEGG